MADAFRQFEALLREFISPAAIDLEFPDDDPAWNLIGTFMPETIGGKREYDTAASDFPAGYEAVFKIKTQTAGRISGGQFSGNTLVQMGKDSHLSMGQAADAKYLDPRKTPLRSYVEIRMILKRILGSVTLNHQQMTADLASNPIEEVAGGAVEDAVKRLRSVILNYFYGDGTASIAQVNNAAGYTVDETAGGTEITVDGGTWGRFMKGDLIVAGSDADPRVQRVGSLPTGLMRVVAVDADDRTIKLQAEPGEGTITLSDNDHLMLAGTYVFNASGTNATNSLAAQGAENLLINSGVFPGSTSIRFPSGLDVDDHTELKAFISDTTSSPVNPTMSEVTLLLDKILDIQQAPPSAFISERSLWTYFSQLERENNALVQVPMGGTFVGAGGVSGPMLSHMEHRFQRFSSKRIREGSILGISPDTWKRYMPLGDRTIHWVYGSGPLAGFGSIFGPAYDGTQLTELADAPFNSYIELGCVDPRRNLRRLGLKTQRDV